MLRKLKNLKKLSIIRSLNLHAVKKNIILIGALAIFIVGNLLVSPFALRLDLSKGKAYTLSSSTKKIVKNLDKEVTINFFVSSDLPTRLLPLQNEVKDLLQEYQRAGGSKIRLKTLDPKKDQKALDQVKELGVPELQFSQVNQNQYAVSSSYFGIVLAQGEKKEVLPQVTETGSLEYNLTSALYKMTRKETPKIAVIGLEPVFDPRQDPVRALRSILTQQFSLDNIEVSSVEASLKTILVFDNTDIQYNENEINSLKSYIKNGGKAIFFIDGVGISENLAVTGTKSSLISLLNEWGIALQSNLILSTSAELVNFGNETVSYLVPYPFWLRADNLNEKVSYFSNVNQLTYPWVSSLQIQKKENIEIKELVKSNKQSWEQKDNFSLNPQTIARPQQTQLKEFIVTAEATEKNGGKVMVIPSSRFTLDRFLSRNTNNIDFILNVINDYASGGALSGIRQRAVTIFPLPDISENQKDIFKYINILLLPGLFGIFGILRLLRRR